MIEIAKASPDRGIFQKDVAVSQSLSLKYLDHIIQALKTARLITNTRGRKSGYVLTREPSEITLFDIHRAFEPGICLVDCLSDTYDCQLSNSCNARDFWSKLNHIIINYFKSVTLEDMVNGKTKFEDLPVS
jgi:Rrf2 family protein